MVTFPGTANQAISLRHIDLPGSLLKPLKWQVFADTLRNLWPRPGDGLPWHLADGTGLSGLKEVWGVRAGAPRPPAPPVFPSGRNTTKHYGGA